MILRALVLLVFSLCAVPSFAAWPVDDTSELVEVGTAFELADGPAWDGGSFLYIPDVKGETLYRYNPATKEITPFLKEAGRISASHFNHGKLYLSDNANARIDILIGKERTTLANLDDSEKPEKRPNDLVVDNFGGVYVTLTKQNQVVYITAAGQVSVAVEEIISPNGITISPDEKTLYVSAYGPKEVWSYDITDAGKTVPGKLFAKMDAGPDKGADGMTIDRAGNVYCTGPAHVWIWSPDGTLLHKIETPTRPINCAFGDNTMQSLYITCFGGVYQQKMLISGRSPQPPATPELQGNLQSKPSTVIPEEIQFQPDMVYATYGQRKLLLDLFTPQHGTESKPAIVVVHGGGWLNGDKSKFRSLSIELAKRGYLVAAIEYRLGGEAPFPAGIHDCNAAVRYLRANAVTFGIDPAKIGAVGGSAGGHLVGLMATGWENKELQGDGGYPDQSSRLQAAVVMAGPMEMTTGSVAERSRNPKSNIWLAGTIDEQPDLYALADAHLQINDKSSPILFMVGEHDNPARNQPSRDKLKANNVWTDVKIYADGKHGCWNQLPWQTEMVADMDQYFQAQFK